MTVYVLLEGIDLGSHLRGIYTTMAGAEAELERLVAERKERYKRDYSAYFSIEIVETDTPIHVG